MSPTIRRVAVRCLLVLAMIGAALAGVVPAASAAYPSEASYACSSYSDIYAATGRPLAETDILAPGTPCAFHDADRFAQEDAVDYYRTATQAGFDRNFMYWAPEERIDFGNRNYAGCKVTHPTSPTNFCPQNQIGFSPIQNVWTGATTAKVWPRSSSGGFIALVCGNYSETGNRAGPIPTIRGVKFEDKNGDGDRDGGEGGLSGVRVHLTKGGVVLDSTTTAGNGSYSFRLNANSDSRLRAGRYVITEDVPTGYQQTTGNPSVTVPYGAADATYDVAELGNQKLADISISKDSETNPTIAGLETTWKLTAKNPGQWDAPSTVITDTVPSNYDSIVSADAPCTFSGRKVTCNLGTLPAGATRVLRFRSLLKPDVAKGTVIVNTAEITTSIYETRYDNNTDSASTTVDTRADLRITKEVSGERFLGGESLEYTLTVSNAGPSVARTVVISDVVPDEIEVTTVPPGCSVSGQAVTCSTAALSPGASAAYVIGGRVRGDPPPVDGTTHSHQLTVDKGEAAFGLEPGASATVPVACPSTAVMTDISTVVRAVDQGTGDVTDVDVLESRLLTPSTGRVTVRNNATGRAQGTVYYVCLTRETGVSEQHRHELLTEPLVTTPTMTLTPGRHTVEIDVGLDNTAVAPGFLIAGTARLVASEQRNHGWALTFRVGSAGADVTVSALPLGNRVTTGASASAPSHSHLLMLEHPELIVSAPPGSSTHSISCADDAKGIVATFDGDYIGSVPEPKTRSFVVFNPTSVPIDVTLDLLCLRITTGPVIGTTRFVDNTAAVASATQELAPGDNSDSVRVVVVIAAEGDGAAPVAAPRLTTFRQHGNEVRGTVKCMTSCRAVMAVWSGGRKVKSRTVVLRSGVSRSVVFHVAKRRDISSVTMRLHGTTYRTRVK